MHVQFIAVYLYHHKQQKYNNMKNFNKALTLAEAKALYTAKDGMHYMDTPHNRQMMKSLVDAQLTELHAKRNNKK